MSTPKVPGSGLPAWGRRGEGWVIGQLVLGAAVVVCGLFGPRWPAAWAAPLAIAGVALGGAGAALFGAGVRHLGASLTPYPRPRADGTLRRDGIYAKVRHPIYGGIVLLALGWALALSPLALVPALALTVFLELKSRREEAWLVEQYPAYAAYRSRVPHRLVPWLH